MKVEFPYVEEESEVFGTVKRPRIKIRVFSEITNNFEVLDEVLVDTGADFSVLPRYIGNLIVDDITTGKYSEIKGVVPGVKLIVYNHKLKLKIDEVEFESSVAIADSDDVPMILGRVKGLDLFKCIFDTGKKTTVLKSNFYLKQRILYH